MTAVHIYAPQARYTAQVNHCSTCERPRRMLCASYEWHGPRWTCAGCGDSWHDEGLEERPFVRGWRLDAIRAVRAKLAQIGVPA